MLSVHPCCTEGRLEALSKPPLFLNLSSCPRTRVHLIAVSVHSEILAISLSALVKHVLSICPWEQPSSCKVIKVVSCWMNHALFFLLWKISSSSTFIPVTTELPLCSLLCLHSLVFLQTVYETSHPVTSGKGVGTAHTFILALGSSSDRLVNYSACYQELRVGTRGFITPKLLMHLKSAL